VKVVFLKDVENTKAGEVRDVSPGYARNFLFPRSAAIAADDRVIEQLSQRQDAARRRVEKALADAREIAGKLKRLTVTVYAKAGDGGRLFGTVTNADIAQQLKREAGVNLDKRKIRIDPPIKSLGPHEVALELHPDVTEKLKVVVAAQ